MADVRWQSWKPDEIAKVVGSMKSGDVLRAGWIPPSDRTIKQLEIDRTIQSAMPKFGIRGPNPLLERKYFLWDAARTVLGRDVPFVYQQTGSCVGASGGNALMTLQCVEIATDRLESFKVPWWLFTYGRSRLHAGIRGRGDGSFGSAWAKAAAEDGMYEIDPEGLPDLPDYKDSAGWIVQSAKTELDWSDGAKIGKDWLAEGRKHLVRTVARVKTANDVLSAVANGYSCILASMLGLKRMVPAGVGNPPVRLGTWDGSWAHQMFIHGAWDHPTLGLIFYVGNNWGKDAHGEPLAGEPHGGFWITDDTLDQVLASRDAEGFALSAYDGYPSRKLRWRAWPTTGGFHAVILGRGDGNAGRDGVRSARGRGSTGPMDRLAA